MDNELMQPAKREARAAFQRIYELFLAEEPEDTRRARIFASCELACAAVQGGCENTQDIKHLFSVVTTVFLVEANADVAEPAHSA